MMRRGVIVLGASLLVVSALASYDALLLVYGPREWFYGLLVMGGPLVPVVLLSLVSARVRRADVGHGPKAAVFAYVLVVVLVHTATQRAVGVSSDELPPFRLLPPSAL